MASTTPETAPAPEGRESVSGSATAEQERRAVVPMRTLLAACRAAAAVSTPPENPTAIPREIPTTIASEQSRAAA